jgi:O-antigen/teichoic acid export membrane protein
MDDNSKHYKLNLFSQYALTFVTSILGFFSAPISLNYWKVEQFGIWAIITSFAAYFAISGLGVDTAAGILMTKNNSAIIKKQIFRKSLTIIVSTTSIFIFAIIIINAIQPNWIFFLGKMDKELEPIARQTFLIFVLFFIINVPFGVVNNGFSAYKKSYINNLINILYSIMLFTILLITIYYEFRLPTYALLSGMAALVINLAKYAIYRKVSKNYSFRGTTRPASTKDHSYRTILSTGIRLSLYGMALLIPTSISNLIISNSISVGSVTPYQLTYKLFYVAFAFLSAINLSAAPLYGKEFSSNNWKWIVAKYESFFMLSVLVGGGIWLGGMLFLKDIIYIWVGHQGYAGILTVALLGAWIFVSSLSNVNYIIINSLNYTKGIALISWFEVIIFIISSFILVQHLGIAGIAASLLIGSLLVTQWALPAMLYRKSQKKLRYNPKILIIILLSFIVTTPIAYFQQTRIEDWHSRMFIGIIVFLAYLALCYTLIPKAMKREFMSKLLSR